MVGRGEKRGGGGGWEEKGGGGGSGVGSGGRLNTAHDERRCPHPEPVEEYC